MEHLLYAKPHETAPLRSPTGGAAIDRKATGLRTEVMLPSANHRPTGTEAAPWPGCAGLLPSESLAQLVLSWCLLLGEPELSRTVLLPLQTRALRPGEVKPRTRVTRLEDTGGCGGRLDPEPGPSTISTRTRIPLPWSKAEFY